MASKDIQPDSDREETRAESTTNDLPTAQAVAQRDGLGLSRRATLATLIGIGGLSLTSNSAAARKAKMWQHDQDADGHKLFDLGTLAMRDNETRIRDFAGANLAIGGDNTLNADTWDSRVDADGNDIVQIGGLQTLNNKTKIKDFEGKNLTIDSNMLSADTWDTDVDAGGNSLTRAETVETNNLFVSNVGASVRGSGTVNEIGHVVQFDRKEFDHQNEFNLNENQFEAADDGFYQVTARIVFTKFTEGEAAQLRRAITDAGGATSFRTVDLAERGSERTSALLDEVIVSYSAVHQLKAGEAVGFRLNKTGSNDEFYGSEMEVHQVG